MQKHVLDSLAQHNQVYQSKEVPGHKFYAQLIFSVPLCNKPIWGSTFSTSSPSNSNISLKTPCAGVDAEVQNLDSLFFFFSHPVFLYF